MGRRGPPPKPTAIRILEGNPSGRPLNENEPQYAAGAVTDDPPVDIAQDAIAAAEWRRLVPMLRQARVLTDADLAALLALCREWSRYRAASAAVTPDNLVIT